MSQFNLNGFNRSPFNTTPEYDANWLPVTTFEELVTGAFGTASDNYVTINAYEKVLTSVEITKTFYCGATGTETVTKAISGTLVYMFECTGEEEVITDGIQWSGQNYLDLTFTETITGTGSVGVRAYNTLTLSENIDTYCYTSIETWLTETNGYELVSAVVGIDTADELVCEMQVSLAPGQTLILDSGNYNAMINGESVIDKHTGEWFDALNRETLGFSVQSASGGNDLDVHIAYTERYL